MSQIVIPKTYETDFYQWTREQTKALRELVNTHQELKHLDALDWENIFQDSAELVAFEYEVDLPNQCPYRLDDLLF
jgi:hypothetical protein